MSESLEKLLAGINPDELLIEVDREMVSRPGGYYYFFRKAWEATQPFPLIEEPYIEFLCQHMEALLLGNMKSGRLAINIPPRHLKTSICVVFSLPFLWTHDPKAGAIFCSRDQGQGWDCARKTRQIIQSKWYQDRWGIALQDDATKVNRFYNNHGGSRQALTVKQQLTGDGASGKYGGLIVLDDPNKPTDTDLDYQEIRNWYSTTLPTRFADLAKSQICIVQQRISQKDLSEFVLGGTENYEHVCLPMEFEPKRKCKTSIGEDWRTKEGELLSPLRNTPEVIQRLKDTFADPRIAQAQLQQQPSLSDGNIFKTEHFENKYTQLPEHLNFTISCDLTFSANKKTSDYAVLQAWGHSLNDGKHYLVDQVREKMGFIASVNRIISLYKRFPNSTILVEKAANGFGVIEMLEKAGMTNIIPVAANKSNKMQRAESVSYLFDRGDVLFPATEPAWFDDYKKELLSFPAGRYDDCVDGTTIYLYWASGSNRGAVDLAAACDFAGELARIL